MADARSCETRPASSIVRSGLVMSNIPLPVTTPGARVESNRPVHDLSLPGRARRSVLPRHRLDRGTGDLLIPDDKVMIEVFVYRK